MNRAEQPSSLPKFLMVIRMAFIVVTALVVLIVGMIVVIILSLLTFGQAQNFIIKNCGRAIGYPILFAAGIKLEIERVGASANRPAIYIANHSSTLDMFILIALGLPKIRFIAKKEFLYNPLFAVMGLLTGQIFIDRGDSAKAIETLNRAYERIQRKGLSLLVMPEGTRIEGGKIGAFKKGAFRLALDLKYPIVPMHFIGTYQLSPGKKLVVYPGTVKVRFYPVIDTSAWTLENLEENVNKLRQTYVQWEEEAY